MGPHYQKTTSLPTTIKIIEHDLRTFQRKDPVVFRPWSSFSFSGYKRSRPKKDKNPHEILLPARKLLLSQRKDFMKNQWGQIPIILNQQRVFGMREEVPAGAFFWIWLPGGMSRLGWYWAFLGKSSGGVGCCLQTTVRYSLIINNFQRLGDGRKTFIRSPLVFDEEEDKENYVRTTPLSDRPSKPPRLLKIRPSGRWI